MQEIAGLLTYGWGMIPVKARFGRRQWTTSMWPKDGRYILPVKARVREAEDVDEGDEASMRLEIR